MTGRPRKFDEAEALEAAMQVFWQKGFAATTKRDLIEATGAASQSLYNVFGDKMQFFEKALEHYRDTRMAMIQSVLEAPGSPLENLRNVARLFGDPPAEFRNGCFMCNSALEFGRKDEDPIARMMAEKFRLSHRLFSETFERARGAGEIAVASDPDSLAALFLSLMNGVAIMYRTQATPEFTVGVMNETLRWLGSLESRSA